MSVCLSVTFVHCAQTAEDIDTISFACDSAMSLLDRFKIWLTSVDHFLSKFCPMTPLLIWASKIFDARCGRMISDSAIVIVERAYRKPSSIFRIVPPLTPRPPLPQNGGSKCTSSINFATRAFFNHLIAPPPHILQYKTNRCYEIPTGSTVTGLKDRLGLEIWKFTELRYLPDSTKVWSITSLAVNSVGLIERLPPSVHPSYTTTEYSASHL